MLCTEWLTDEQAVYLKPHHGSEEIYLRSRGYCNCPSSRVSIIN